MVSTNHKTGFPKLGFNGGSCFKLRALKVIYLKVKVHNSLGVTCTYKIYVKLPQLTQF